jgi:hypothetical protein
MMDTVAEEGAIAKSGAAPETGARTIGVPAIETRIWVEW